MYEAINKQRNYHIIYANFIHEYGVNFYELYSECPYNLTKHETKLENIHVNGRERVCALGLKMQMY